MSDPIEPPRDPQTNIQPGAPRPQIPGGPTESETHIQAEPPRIDIPADDPPADDRDHELPSLVNVTAPRTNVIREYQRVLAQYTPYIWVTPVLVVVNLAMFIATLSDGAGFFSPDLNVLLGWGANYAPKTLQGEPWRLITSQFIHGNIIVFAINMLTLALGGFAFERFFGNIGFLLLYLVTGAAGALTTAALHSNLLSAGSGASLFGVFGAVLAISLPSRPIPWPDLARELRIAAGSFILLNFFLALGLTGFDWGMHLAGFGSGFLAGFILGVPVAPDLRQRRLVRNVIFGLASVAILGVGTWTLQGAVSEFAAAAQHFADVEARAIPLVNDAFKRSQAGQLNDEEFARILEKDVLPGWTAARQRLERLQQIDPKDQERARLLLNLARSRQEGWELVVEGVRTQNPLKFAEAQAKQQAADAAIQQLKALQKK